MAKITVAKLALAEIAAPALVSLNSGTVLTVGAGMEFATLADACHAAVSGDTIAVEAGTYTNDFTTINASLRLISIGGTVYETANEPPPNDKALITVNANLSIQGFSFTGGSDGNIWSNVSGIRLQSGNLAVNYCNFHDMQEGILADPDPTATVTINHSEFANNGTGTGYTHNIYIGSVASLTITNSYFHGANVGHEIKSRAMVTTISNNVIADGATGTASYDIDVPNAGAATITNNLIEKGPAASNAYAIHYGGETQFAYAKNSLTISGNTILNDLGASAVAVLNQSAVNGLNVSANITNNRFYGFTAAQLLIGAGHLAGNTNLAAEPGYSTASPWQAVPVLAIAAGPQLLNLNTGNHVVSGGTNRLTINDQYGGNTVSGGAGGIALIAAGGWDTITTQAGAADAITLSGRNSVLNSAGTDHISAAGSYENITAAGQATITGSGFSTYTLDGAGEHLTASGSGWLNVGAAGAAAFTDTGGDYALTILAGGNLSINDISASVSGATASTATVSGAVTGSIAGSGLISLVTTDSGATIQAGTGQLDVQGSAGTDTYVFQAGNAGQDTISGFKPGTDSLQFNGFTGNPVASASVENNNTVLTLSDGATITFSGVTLPGYGNAPAPAPTAPGTSGPVTLNCGGQTLTGNATSLAVTDNAGGNTITGGAGGILAVIAAGYDSLSTQSGAADTISLGGYNTLMSCGTDQITLAGNYSQITATGAATITEQGGYNSFDLEGQDTLTASGGGQATVGARALASIATDGSATLEITKLAGGSLSLTEQLATGPATLSLAGGAATICAASGPYAGITATLGAGDQVNLGAGNTTLIGGAGQDSITGGTGAAIITLGQADTLTLGLGNLTVQGGSADIFAVSQDAQSSMVIFGWSASDSFVTAGQSAPAITAEQVTGGNTWLTFAGGAQVELVGFTQLT